MTTKTARLQGKNKLLTTFFFLGSLTLQAHSVSAMEKLESFERSYLYEDLTPIMGPTVPKMEQSDVAQFLDVFSIQSFYSFEKVISQLHTSLETETDLIYLVNTSEKENLCQSFSISSIPAQHMVMMKRVHAERPLFIRNGQGVITDFNQENLEFVTMSKKDGLVDHYETPQIVSPFQFDLTAMTPYIPISSGVRGNGGIATFSGVFRLNEVRTNNRRDAKINPKDPMQFPVYINGEYDSGQESGVALHGTPETNWWSLGKRAASHGCIRLHTNFSKWNMDYLFERGEKGELVGRSELVGDVRLWNRKDLFPSTEAKFTKASTGKKMKVLVVLFQGYDQLCL